MERVREMLNLLRRLVQHITASGYEVEARLDPETVIVHDIPSEPIFSKKGLVLTMRNSKPVHKAPQFPCNFGTCYTEGKPPFKSSRNWAKVTCGNCLRSSLKKQYDKRRLGKFLEGFTHVTGKETPLLKGEFLKGLETLRCNEGDQAQ